ncbi:MAG: lysine exporter LysO family protein [Bacillota bacterium]
MNLWLILAVLVGGLIVGYFRSEDKGLASLAGYIIRFGLYILIAVMGMRIGADAGIIADLGRIGLQAAFLAVGAIAGSVILLQLFSFYLKAALEVSDKNVAGYEDMVKTENGEALILTGQILLLVGVGIAGGWLLLPGSFLPVLEDITVVSLAVLLLGVGIDIGQNRTIFRQIKALGVRLVIIPLFVALGSILGTVLVGTVLGIAANESAAVGAGFGWYSLSAVMLTDLHSVELGSLAFLTNIIREMLALISIPLVARYISAVAAIAPGGATTMDVTLPLLKETSGEAVLIPAFINGVILSALVPIVVPFLLNL